MTQWTSRRSETIASIVETARASTYFWPSVVDECSETEEANAGPPTPEALLIRVVAGFGDLFAPAGSVFELSFFETDASES